MRIIHRVKNLVKRIMNDPKPVKLFVATIIRRMPLDIGSMFGLNIRVHNYLIRLHRSSLSVTLWYDPLDRKDDYEFLTRYLREGDTYFDVGANIGSTLIPAAKRVGPRGRVIGFEPHTKLFSYLEDNVLLNGLRNARILNVAVGEEERSAFISDESDDTTNRIRDGQNGTKIQIVPLDKYVSQCEGVDLLKVDVEGYEKTVFAGGREFLSKTKCVYFEVSEHGCEEFGYLPIELLSILEQAGFAIYKKSDSESIMRLERSCVKGVFDAFAVRDIDDFCKRTGWKVGGLSCNNRGISHSDERQAGTRDNRSIDE